MVASSMSDNVQKTTIDNIEDNFEGNIEDNIEDNIEGDDVYEITCRYCKSLFDSIDDVSICPDCFVGVILHQHVIFKCCQCENPCDLPHVNICNSCCEHYHIGEPIYDEDHETYIIQQGE